MVSIGATNIVPIPVQNRIESAEPVESGSAVVATDTPAMAPGAPALSPEAAAVVLQEQGQAGTGTQPRSVYEDYMPTREGFSAHALAIGIKNPDAVSNSAGKNPAEIAADARARLDANYAKMEASGAAFQESSIEGVDWNSLAGELDTRSLAAVRDNGGGLFTEEEQNMADCLMAGQKIFRAGLYCGPTRLYGQFMASGLLSVPDHLVENEMKRFDADAKDKDSVPAQLGRASMRVLLGLDKSQALFGQTDPKDKMLNLLVDALQKAYEKDPSVMDRIGNIRTADDLKDEPWFADSADALNAILQGGDTQDADSDAPATATA